MQIAEEGAGRPTQPILAARTQTQLLAELLAVIGFRVGNRHVRENAIRVGGRLRGVLQLILPAFPVRGGAGEVGKIEIYYRIVAVDMDRVGARFANVKPLVMGLI